VETPPVVPGETVLDLAALQSLATQNNPTLREAWARVEAARGRWVQAGLLPNPSIGYSGQQLGSNSTEQNGMVLGQEIVTGGKLGLDRGVVSQEIERAHQQMHAQYNRVLTDVAIAYYDALAAQQRVDMARRLVAISEQFSTTVESLLKASEATKIELLQARIEQNNARITLGNAENRLTAAWRTLAAVIGLPTMTPQPLTGTLSEVPHDLGWDESLARILGQSPELAAAQADVERARWAYQRALKQVVPNIDVQAIVQDDRDVQKMDGAVQIMVPVPVFNRNQGGVREAYANIAAAEKAVERVQLRLEQRLASVFERYANALQQVERYQREILPAAQEQLDLVSQAYRAGEVNYITLLIAQRTYFQTNLATIDSQRELAAAASEIRGLLLIDSLTDSPANR
jgi:cobalt-zinc-cadmium efflux system outer membrane protein